MEFKGICLVTGAAGFIGGHVVRHLVDHGVRVRASDRPDADAAAFGDLEVEFVPADLAEPGTLPRLFDGGVDRVVHLGATCNLSTPYEKLYPVNVAGAEAMAKLALDAGVRCYVQVSSTSVYGPYRGDPFAEDHPRQPQDDYGRSKRDGEDAVWKRIPEGLPAIVARPCTVYGPGCNDGAGKVFSRPTRILAVPGSGRQRLSNVRVEDTAGAIVHLLHSEGAIGRAFNIADDSHPTLEHALGRAAEAFGTTPPRFHLPLPCVRALARLQGWSARISGGVPDLEYDAVRLLGEDYIVDNGALKKTGYELVHPDFDASMRDIGEGFRSRSTHGGS
jgi:UDP-glucose 4-epimerase